MTDIVLHSKTQRDIEAFISRPNHAMALIGERGVGKSFIAQYVASQLLGLSQESVQNHPYVYFFAPDEKNSIKVETAKEIVNIVRLKTTGTKPVRRIIIIEHADTMTVEGQNTLLKTIEEPPLDTVILMTISDRTSVLPTIRSRVQTIQVHTPAITDTKRIFTDKDTEAINKVMLISNGKVGLSQALLEDDSNHPLVQAITKAKNLLSIDTYDKLQAIDDITKKKEQHIIVEALQLMAMAMIKINGNDDTKQHDLQKWTSILDSCHTAAEQLSRNGQPKLVLTNLFLHI